MIKAGTNETASALQIEEQQTILILDDESYQREYLSELLQIHGYQVMAFENAYEALSAVLQTPSPDLVITDTRMPHMDGIEFVKALKHILPAVPVVMMTGTASVETYYRAFALGVMEYLHKPIGESDLIRTVSSVLRKVS